VNESHIKNLAQREEQLDREERELTKREQIVLKNERAHIRKKLDLAGHEREIAAMEAELMSMENGLYSASDWRQGAGQAGLVEIGDGSYSFQEVAKQERLQAIELREASIEKRRIALQARIEAMQREAERFKGYDAALKGRSITVEKRRKELEEISTLFKAEQKAGAPAPTNKKPKPASAFNPGITNPAQISRDPPPRQPPAPGPLAPLHSAAREPKVIVSPPKPADEPKVVISHPQNTPRPAVPPPAVPPAVPPVVPPASAPKPAEMPRPAVAAPSVVPPRQSRQQQENRRVPGQLPERAEPSRPKTSPVQNSRAPSISGIVRLETKKEEPDTSPVTKHPTKPPFDIATREHQRIELKTEVNFESETNFYVGWSGDISQGGIFLATHEVLDKGTQIKLKFKLPTGRQIIALGEVVWVKEFNQLVPDQTPGMGIRFVGLDPADARAISSFTLKRDPIFYDDESIS